MLIFLILLIFSPPCHTHLKNKKQKQKRTALYYTDVVKLSIKSFYKTMKFKSWMSIQSQPLVNFINFKRSIFTWSYTNVNEQNNNLRAIIIIIIIIVIMYHSISLNLVQVNAPNKLCLYKWKIMIYSKNVLKWNFVSQTNVRITSVPRLEYIWDGCFDQISFFPLP